jgi:hypothetical protein
MIQYSVYARSAIAGLALTFASVGSLEARTNDSSQLKYTVKDVTSQQDTSSHAGVGYGVLGLALIAGTDLVNRKIEEKIFSKQDP